MRRFTAASVIRHARGFRTDWMLFGRAVNGTAVGLSIMLTTLTVYNLRHAGRLLDTPLADVTAVFGIVALAVFILGWAVKSRQLLRLGLFLSMLLLGLRVVFIMLVQPGDQAVWLSLGSAVIAGWAYIKETWADEDDGRG